MKTAHILFATLLIESLVSAAEPTGKPGSLWARLSVEDTVFVPDLKREPAARRFYVFLRLVNEGSTVVDAKIVDSKLIVNGKVLEDSGFIFRNGSMPIDFRALRPHGVLAFGLNLAGHFNQPGTYRLAWKGEGFESPEVEFRVLPPETYSTSWGTETPASKVLQKLNEIRLPQVTVGDKTVRELVQFLNEESIRLDPRGAGVKFELRDAQLIGGRKLTKEWNNVFLFNALRRMTELAGLRYDIEGDKVVIHGD